MTKETVRALHKSSLEPVTDEELRGQCRDQGGTPGKTTPSSLLCQVGALLRILSQN